MSVLSLSKGLPDALPSASATTAGSALDAAFFSRAGLLPNRYMQLKQVSMSANTRAEHTGQVFMPVSTGLPKGADAARGGVGGADAGFASSNGASESAAKSIVSFMECLLMGDAQANAVARFQPISALGEPLSYH